MDRLEEYNAVMNYMQEDVLLTCKYTYLVSASWWSSWLSFAASSDSSVGRPVKMKNYECLSSFSITVKEYKLIHPEAWEVLKKYYDCKPEILIFIIDKQPDLHPINLYIYLMSNTYEVLLVSSKISFEYLKEFLMINYNQNLSQCYFEFDNIKIENESRTLAEAGVKCGKNIYLREIGYVNKVNNNKSEKNSYDNNRNRIEPEEFMEPDPAPVAVPDISEEKMIDMVQEAIALGYLDLQILPITKIKENLNDFKRADYEF